MPKNTTEWAHEKGDNHSLCKDAGLYCPKSLSVWHLFFSTSFPAFLQDFVAYSPPSTSVNYVQNDNLTIPKNKTEVH